MSCSLTLNEKSPLEWGDSPFDTAFHLIWVEISHLDMRDALHHVTPFLAPFVEWAHLLGRETTYVNQMEASRLLSAHSTRFISHDWQNKPVYKHMVRDAIVWGVFCAYDDMTWSGYVRSEWEDLNRVRQIAILSKLCLASFQFLFFTCYHWRRRALFSYSASWINTKKRRKLKAVCSFHKWSDVTQLDWNIEVKNLESNEVTLHLIYAADRLNRVEISHLDIRVQLRHVPPFVEWTQGFEPISHSLKNAHSRNGVSWRSWNLDSNEVNHCVNRNQSNLIRVEISHLNVRVETSFHS